MNQLKLYRQAIVGKTIVGLGKDRVILDTGEWWQLAIPFSGDRLDFVGQPIKSIRVIDGLLELIISKQLRLHLHWKDEHGFISGPRFPEPGKIRAWDREGPTDPAWRDLERLIELWERAAKHYCSPVEDNAVEQGTAEERTD